MHPDMMVAWIANPRDISAGATMPNLGLTEAEAIAVRDYLWLADPSWMAAAQVPEEPEPTKRPVSWKEVQQRVFGQICVHCHMDPALNEGRGGPGHDGGFGHDPAGVVLETRGGAVDALPKLRGVLLARRQEAARDAVSAGIEPQALTRPAVSGMPMGHPPISDEDLSLVLGWIDQGGPP